MGTKRNLLASTAFVCALGACSGGTVPPPVTTACADVSGLQPLLPIIAGLLGPAAPIVQAVYAAVEGICLTAPEVAAWIAAIQQAIANHNGNLPLVIPSPLPPATAHALGLR